MIFPKRRVRMHLASLKLTSRRMTVLKRLYEVNIAILENNVSPLCLVLTNSAGFQ